MRVKIQQFLGTNHSWRCVGLDMGRALLAHGHDVHLCSTNGYEHFPVDLRPHVRDDPELGIVAPFHTAPRVLDSAYDLQLSYTAPHNFGHYLRRGTKNRFGIFNYETTVVPKHFNKFHRDLDLLLPSSGFAGRVFVDSGFPEEKVRVLPHGIATEEYEDPSHGKLELKTDRSVKVLANIAQPHLRKNIPGLLKAWGKAFEPDDDVCLVLKVVAKPLPKYQGANSKRRGPPPKRVQPFDVDFRDIYRRFCETFPKRAPIEMVTDFLPSMVPLYNATQVVFSLTHAECFWLPGLEGLATKNVVVAPRYGGQLEFLNDQNSFLVEGKKVRAPRAMQYWEASPRAEMFQPDIDDAVEKLRAAVFGLSDARERFEEERARMVKKLTWANVSQELVSLGT